MFYGRRDPKEYFAELYTQMVHTPEAVYEAYVDAPKSEIAEAASSLNESHGDLLEEKAAEDPDLDWATQQVATSTHELAEAARHADLLRGQWDLMRTEVFGLTDAMIESELEAMEARYPEATELEELRSDAEKCATPEQFERLVDSYKIRLSE